MHWKMVVLVLQCGNVIVLPLHLTLLLSQLLSLPLPVNPTVSVVTPVTSANTAFLLVTLIATHTAWC